MESIDFDEYPSKGATVNKKKNELKCTIKVLNGYKN